MSMGIDLAPTDVAYRCNIVTVRDEDHGGFFRRYITSAEGAALFTSLAPHVPGVTVKGRGQLPQSPCCPARVGG